MNETALAVFESKKIRRYYDEQTETWYFSVIDVIEALTVSINPTDYLKKLRKRDIELGTYLGTNCPQVEMVTETGKKRKTLGGSVQHILRLVQSIPSPKAEPFKQWLAKVGYERIQDMSDPARSLDRAREYWQQHGRSEKWIQQRMMGQETRNKLTDYWQDHEITKGEEYAILTNIIHQEWSGVSVKKHKDIKGIKTQNLRDHMSEAELIFTALAELSTRQIAESVDATGMVENADAGKKGGKIAKKARLELESKTGKSVITSENYLPPVKKQKQLKYKPDTIKEAE
ncbi:MAG: BRO family protein [Candidatus Desantisbacteria bacterium]